MRNEDRTWSGVCWLKSGRKRGPKVTLLRKVSQSAPNDKRYRGMRRLTTRDEEAHLKRSLKDGIFTKIGIALFLILKNCHVRLQVGM